MGGGDDTLYGSDSRGLTSKWKFSDAIKFQSSGIKEQIKREHAVTPELGGRHLGGSAAAE